MALTGLHVTAAHAGGPRQLWNAKQPVLAHPQWAETLASSGTTGQSIGADGMILHYKAGAEGYLVQAPSPDATQAIGTTPNTARIHIWNAETLDVYAKAGDKVNFVAGTLAGLHVTCAFAGRPDSTRNAVQPVLAFPVWSETLSADGTTTQAAPEDGCIFHVTVSTEKYFAVGVSPDASLAVSTAVSSARIHLSAGEKIDLYVRQGYKLACLAA